MVISQCKKKDFKVISEINQDKGIFDLRWGFEGVTEQVRQLNELTGEYELTGEIRETDLCTYELHRIFEENINTNTLDKIFNKAQRCPKVSELQQMCEAFGIKEDRSIEWMRKHLTNAVTKYDKSKEVEDFTINGIHLWLNSEMRDKVRENLEYCQ